MDVAGRIGSVVLAAAVLAGCELAVGSPAPTTPGITTPSPTPSGITREEAIAVARAAAPRYATAGVLHADAGRFDDFVPAFTAEHYTPVPAPDRLVWRITLGEQPSPTGGQGTDVIIDFWDGRVILATEWVS